MSIFKPGDIVVANPEYDRDGEMWAGVEFLVTKHGWTLIAANGFLKRRLGESWGAGTYPNWVLKQDEFDGLDLTLDI